MIWSAPRSTPWLPRCRSSPASASSTQPARPTAAACRPGLAEGAIATAIGLLFWLVLGAFFVRRYDKQGRDRMDPKLLAYVHEAADTYRGGTSS